MSTALTAVLRALDDNVTACADIPGQGTSSPVELEWIGLDHAKYAFGHHDPNYDPSKLADAVCAERGWVNHAMRFYTGVPSGKQRRSGAVAGDINSLLSSRLRVPAARECPLPLPPETR